MRSIIDVQERWRKRQAPDLLYVDSLVLADGTLKAMCLSSVKSEDGTSQWGWHHLMTAFSDGWECEHWSSLTQLCATNYGPYRAYGGEGSHGSIGWIALASNDPEERLHWMIYSTDSNPFVSITVDDQYVVATNNNGNRWQIPILNPNQVEIEAPSNS